MAPPMAQIQTTTFVNPEPSVKPINLRVEYYSKL